jgi:hypothetical protein
LHSPHNNRKHAYLQRESRLHPLDRRRGISSLSANTGLTASAQDIISGDELISDSYDLKEVDGVAYEADCAKITIGGETFDTGANASAEGGDEDADDQKETKIDVVHSFRLQETNFDKKAYLGHLKCMSPTLSDNMIEYGTDHSLQPT